MQTCLKPVLLPYSRSAAATATTAATPAPAARPRLADVRGGTGVPGGA